MKRILALLVSVVSIALMAGSAGAATLNIVGGQLMGASDVIVDGSSYNVEFLDGTCIALYNGCDSASDFTFQSVAAALLASQALLDQVFVDGPYAFDTNPETVFGCESVDFCDTTTGYALSGGSGVFLIAVARNSAPSYASDIAYPADLERATDTGSFEAGNFAVWAPVPEPATATLLGLGLLGLSGRKRREG